MRVFKVFSNARLCGRLTAGRSLRGPQCPRRWRPRFTRIVGPTIMPRCCVGCRKIHRPIFQSIIHMHNTHTRARSCVMSLCFNPFQTIIIVIIIIILREETTRYYYNIIYTVVPGRYTIAIVGAIYSFGNNN